MGKGGGGEEKRVVSTSGLHFHSTYVNHVKVIQKSERLKRVQGTAL